MSELPAVSETLQVRTLTEPVSPSGGVSSGRAGRVAGGTCQRRRRGPLALDVAGPGLLGGGRVRQQHGRVDGRQRRHRVEALPRLLLLLLLLQVVEVHG